MAVTDLAPRVDAIRDRIASAGGDPATVAIVGAKPPSVAACEAALAAGIVDLGENRAQELLAKAAVLDGPRWHFIGRLQRNKVRALAPVVSLWQSVDRLTAVEALAERAGGASVLVQVNVSDEPQKGGCPPAEAPPLVRAATDAGLRVLGLMAIGPFGDPEAARPGFRLLRSIADDLQLDVRSMGMSADLEVAVEEGSTMIRVGTHLFGPRHPTDLRPD